MSPDDDDGGDKGKKSHVESHSTAGNKITSDPLPLCPFVFRWP